MPLFFLHNNFSIVEAQPAGPRFLGRNFPTDCAVTAGLSRNECPFRYIRAPPFSLRLLQDGYSSNGLTTPTHDLLLSVCENTVKTGTSFLGLVRPARAAFLDFSLDKVFFRQGNCFPPLLRPPAFREPPFFLAGDHIWGGS